jgi:hypothetical protein
MLARNARRALAKLPDGLHGNLGEEGVAGKFGHAIDGIHEGGRDQNHTVVILLAEGIRQNKEVEKLLWPQ